MRARGLLGRRMQVTSTTTTPARRRLIMKTAGLLLGTLTALLDLLRNRYRTGEGADWIADTLEVFEDARNPTELRETLAECMLDYTPGKMKPPRIDELVSGALQTLIAMTDDDATDLPGKALRIRAACMHMLDPYDAGAKLLARAPSGVYVLAPAGYTITHQAISESSEASTDATSIKVKRSSSGGVRRRELPTGQTCAPLLS